MADVWPTSVFSTKKVLRKKNALDYLLTIHTFTRFKFTCSLKSFMKLLLWLCLPWELKNNYTFVHRLLLTRNTVSDELEYVFIFPWIWWEIILEFYCSVTLSNDAKWQTEKNKIKQAGISLRISRCVLS